MFDGSSREPQRLDVRVRGGEIVEIGAGLRVETETEIPADGLWLTPGFVDPHSHSDAAVLSGEGMEQRALSGVTTEIVAQDGLGLSFTSGSGRAIRETVHAIAGVLPDRDFVDVSDYLAEVAAGAYARTATLVPHGNLRAVVCGPELRPASSAEQRRLAGLAKRGIEQGAVGVSTGLSYAPALASETDELVSLMRALPAHTPYVSHVRDYGGGLRESIREAVEICERSGASLHLSHLHVSGSGRAGQAETYLADLDGVDGATFDSYPYISGCTFLRSVLPEFTQGWSAEELLARLAIDSSRDAVIAELNVKGPGPTVAVEWDRIACAGLVGAAEKYAGADIVSRAASLSSTPGDVVVDALIASHATACIVVTQGHIDNVRTLAADSRHLVGSDGIMGAGIPHPRAVHSFFRFLSWVQSRELAVPLEEMIARMTGRSAQRFGLRVGRVQPTWPADLLLIDPERVAEGPDGAGAADTALVHAFISGERTVHDGVWLGNRMHGLVAQKGHR